MAQHPEQLEQSKQQNPLRILRLFGADAEQVRRTAEVLPQGTEVRCVSRGGETLVLLRTANAEDLARAEQLFRTTWQDELYGIGEETLLVCLTDQLRKQGQAFVCADAQSGALLEPRMEEISDADSFFDFGANSYANPRIRKRLIETGQAYVAHHGGGILAQTLGMLPTACRLAHSHFAVGCLSHNNGLFLLVGNLRGCWVRQVSPDENAALWMMDILRRAVSQQIQLEKTLWVKYGAELPAILQPISPSPPSHPPTDSSTSQKRIQKAAKSPRRKQAPPPANLSESASDTLSTSKGQPPEELPVAIPLSHPAINEEVAEVVFPPPEEKFHLFRLLFGFLFVCLAAAAGAAAVWVYTGGSWNSFLEWSGIRQFSLSGATLALLFPFSSL